MTDSPSDFFNVVANIATIIGGAFVSGIIIFVLIKVRRIAERLEQVIAPKTGIEGFLSMCERVVECDPDGTCVVADSGEIVLVNKAMEDISGYHRSELVGRSIEVLVPDSTKTAHPQYREGFITGPSSRPMRGLSLRHKRGHEKPVGINLNHYTDASGGYTIAKVRLLNSNRQSGEMARFHE